ncbi:hypothetical protein HPP92_020848 [Vanilla planifolia]|uniref:PQ-loop repeat family protein / transmembrane family protein n=1 Tax=Vanilla planifolia TaxID=51239 RepID=A0A835Q6T1_VANPL|nr:hypothetical protein HPP92_020848 [Vanilla planifolia]
MGLLMVMDTHLINHLSRARDIIAMILGVVSVISWGIAEVPQIITNYKQKSTAGLSIAFLMTWIIGDIFNLVGCYLEPATLPTQFYMALLYTITTVTLTTQAIYYGYAYQRLKASEVDESPKMEKLEYEDVVRNENNDVIKGIAIYGHQRNLSVATPIKAGTGVVSSSIPVGSVIGSYGSIGRDLYYMSARSLSASPVPTVGSWVAHSCDPFKTPPNRMPPVLIDSEVFIREPLRSSFPSHSSLPSNIKNTFCVVSSTLFLFSIYGLQLLYHGTGYAKPSALVFPVGRKLLQLNSLNTSLSEGGGNSVLGNYLGWAMAAIYMGGRIPQIWLNIKRRNVEGLSLFMFIFALVGNSTYVASILVNNSEWSAIRPNLPWLIDAGGLKFILCKSVLLLLPTFK